MKGLIVVLAGVGLAVGGWYLLTHRTGDWVVTVSGNNGQTVACFKMTDTTLTQDIFKGTVSWHVVGQQLNFPKRNVRPYPAMAGNWDAAFALAGVDGDLCGNGPYPDPVILARRVAQQAANAIRERAPEAQRQLQDAAQQAGDAMRDLFRK